MANGSKWWQPNQLLQKMETDLGILPMFFARETDYVLVHSLPEATFLASLQDVGFPVPGFREINDALDSDAFLQVPKNRLLPWGWSPATHRLLSPLKESCSPGFIDSPASRWSDNHRKVRSKLFALDILRKLHPLLPDEHRIQQDLTGEECFSKKDIENKINRWGKIMVKLPWSSSGRGLQPITKLPVHGKVWEKLLGMIREQGSVLVEPFLDKVFDLAFQFNLHKGKVSYLGNSFFITDSKGQYRGNYLNGFPPDVDQEVKALIGTLPEWLLPSLVRILEQSDLARVHEGNFGVDTLLFRDSKGKMRINPCLEINVRQNMGLLSLQLEKFLASASKGLFSIRFDEPIGHLNFTEEMKHKHPLRFSNGKIESGFLSLTEVNSDSRFGAWVLVER